MKYKQIIIDGTQCRYAHFDGGNTQRLLCAIDDCFCDCYRENECYYKQLKAKEQECEELKELVKKQKDVLIHKTILADEYEKAYSFENLKVAKLKYCLTEIKEIAEGVKGYDPLAKQILQKISEVE